MKDNFLESHFLIRPMKIWLKSLFLFWFELHNFNKSEIYKIKHFQLNPSHYLEYRKFLTLNHDARVEIDTALLAFAYAVSILQKINPALKGFENSFTAVHFHTVLKFGRITTYFTCLNL